MALVFPESQFLHFEYAPMTTVMLHKQTFIYEMAIKLNAQGNKI